MGVYTPHELVLRTLRGIILGGVFWVTPSSSAFMKSHPMGCRESNPGWRVQKQTLYPLYTSSSQGPFFLFFKSWVHTPLILIWGPNWILPCRRWIRASCLSNTHTSQPRELLPTSVGNVLNIALLEQDGGGGRVCPYPGPRGPEQRATVQPEGDPAAPSAPSPRQP